MRGCARTDAGTPPPMCRLSPRELTDREIAGCGRRSPVPSPNITTTHRAERKRSRQPTRTLFLALPGHTTTSRHSTPPPTPNTNACRRWLRAGGGSGAAFSASHAGAGCMVSVMRTPDRHQLKARLCRPSTSTPLPFGAGNILTRSWQIGPDNPRTRMMCPTLASCHKVVPHGA
jgi:hypothetical protein